MSEEWISVEDIPKEKVDKYLVKISLSELKKFFSKFDRYWLQINFKENLACISNEGVDYEPIIFGDLEKEE
jgi:hypothetical protein